jgi:hypothetical protein
LPMTCIGGGIVSSVIGLMNITVSNADTII